eukprot:Protomagalhaensia_wolfi_Nauph_80__1680@NODE_203_length_3195_cov_39_308935_g152_i0_p1_GENE_NODE_203_length_3195_cov_39_308935_g152_i0NODE_203_length_3195_cov_39_308935_g152_i0_p1_ORF_typecomplete_len510_score101_79_NODE_203_length_3195_cov_39_308935_g152_i016533182
MLIHVAIIVYIGVTAQDPADVGGWMLWGKSLVNRTTSGFDHLLTPPQNSSTVDLPMTVNATLDEDTKSVWDSWPKPWKQKPVKEAEPKEEVLEEEEDRSKWYSSRDGVVQKAGSLSSSIWGILGKAPDVWKSLRRVNGTEYNDSDQVGDADVDQPSKPKSNDDETASIGGPGSVPSGSSSDQMARLLPASLLLKSLRCKPEISFASCVEHCLSLIPKDQGGYSLTNHLMRSDAAARRRLDEKGKTSIVDLSHLEGHGRKSLITQLDMPDEMTGFNPWEVIQLKGCVTAICAEDYLHTPLPGCLDAKGRVVPPGLRPIRSPNGTNVGPDDYRDIDFYDPHRLEFWREIGLFKWQRVWYDIVHGQGILRYILVPVFLLVLLSLPMLVLVLVVPGLSSGVMESHPSWCSDRRGGGGMGETRVCDGALIKPLALRRLKQLVDSLTWISQAFSPTSTFDRQEVIIELTDPLRSQPPSSNSQIADEQVKVQVPGTAGTIYTQAGSSDIDLRMFSS